jgi:hypothetical protein
MKIRELFTNREPDATLEGNRDRVLSAAMKAYPGRSELDALALRVMCLERHTAERNAALNANASQAQTIATQEARIARLSA